MKNWTLIFCLTGSCLLNAQRVERLTAQPAYIKAATADSLHYYYIDDNLTTFMAGIHMVDEQKNTTDLMTFDDQSFMYYFDEAVICNEGKCILGKSAFSTTVYYVFHDGVMDSLFSSNAEFEQDHIIIGSQVYFHDTRTIYRSGLTGSTDLQVIYASQDASDFTGIGHFYKVGQSIIFADNQLIAGKEYLKRLDLTNNSITVLDSIYGNYAGTVYNNEFYYINANDFYKKIRKVNTVGAVSTLYTEAGFTNGIQDILGVNANGVVCTIYSGTGTMVGVINGGVLTPINHSSSADPYPHGPTYSYTAGEYIYFSAYDTVASTSTWDDAIWITDGTLTGTKKLVSEGSPGMPAFFPMDPYDHHSGNCYEDLWIGNTLENTAHINGIYNIVEEFDTLIGTHDYFVSHQGKYLYFNTRQEWDDQNHVYRISCDIAASVNELSLADISVFPNPTQDKIELHFPALGATASQLSLLDLNGKVLAQQKNSSGFAEFDLSGLNSGVYFVRVVNEKGNATLRVIKQ